MLFELVLMLVVLSLSFTLVASLRKNETLRRAIGNAIVHEAELDETILELKGDCLRCRLQLAETEASRDKWQVECAKLRATVERQAGDIVRLETSVKTAQREQPVSIERLKSMACGSDVWLTPGDEVAAWDAERAAADRHRLINAVFANVDRETYMAIMRAENPSATDLARSQQKESGNG